MSKYQVTVSLQFDVTVPIDADSEAEARDEAEHMGLSEYFDWAGCASYNMNIEQVEIDE